MTERPWHCAFRSLLVSALAAFCLWRGIEAASAYFGSEDAYAYLADWRSAARGAPEGNLALLCDSAEDISPIDRSRLIAVSWERAHGAVSIVDASSSLKSVDCVLSSNWHSSSAGEKLKAGGFSVASTNEFVKTWVRKDGVRRETGDSGRVVDASLPRGCEWMGESWLVPCVSVTREISALAVELAMCILALWLVHGLRGVGWSALALAVVVAVALGTVALSHPLLPPNGLGVYGGKAKLLYECGGFPEAFMQSPGGKVLQPSYPPGLVLLAYLHFALSGGCGDRLVQMLGVFAMAGVCLSLLRKSSGLRDALPVLLFCLCPVAVRMSAGFYAEPFAALMLLTGWSVAGRGRRIAGAFVMGLAGSFRPEAGVVAAVFAAGACLVGCRCREWPAAFAASVAPAFAWFVVCKLLGWETLPDWDVVAVPKLARIAYASWIEAKTLGLLALPIAMLVFLLRPFHRLSPSRNVARSLVPMTLLLLAIPAACGFYAGPHPEWMAENTIPRLVWYVAAVPFLELVDSRNSRIAALNKVLSM